MLKDTRIPSSPEEVIAQMDRELILRSRAQMIIDQDPSAYRYLGVVSGLTKPHLSRSLKACLIRFALTIGGLGILGITPLVFFLHEQYEVAKAIGGGCALLGLAWTAFIWVRLVLYGETALGDKPDHQFDRYEYPVTNTRL